MSALVPLFTLALATQAAAPASPLTLAQAVERALAASAGVQQAEALQRAAEADLGAARALRLPQVDLQAGYSRLSDVPELFLPLPGGGQRTIFPNIPDNYRARAGVSLPLFTGGRLEALGRAAERERAGSERDVLASRADVALETAAAYWALVTARESERVLAEALQAYDAHLQDARNREQAGV
ncbi:MAG TPA: TolC family protein, partial [Vicinamibacteria bacterium]|nr:TolC family protein [Vicinamibacteria bacterium]